jgi:hypothetical protein
MTTKLHKILAKVDQAEAARVAALTELDTAQREQAVARKQAAVNAWQDWTDQWDPQADDKAVADARTALEEALRAGPLAVVLAVLLAEHRRTANHALAHRARGVGATVPDHRPAPDPTPAAELLPRLLDDLATHTVATETTAADTTVRDAIAAVPGGQPTAYRITSSRRDSWVTQIGGQPRLTWTDGVVVLAADDARVTYFRRRSNDYTIEPLFVVADPAIIATRAQRGSQHDSQHGLANNRPGEFKLTPAERAAAHAKRDQQP